MCKARSPSLGRNSFSQFCSPASESFVALVPQGASALRLCPQGTALLPLPLCFVTAPPPLPCTPMFPKSHSPFPASPKHLAARQFLLEAFLPVISTQTTRHLSFRTQTAVVTVKALLLLLPSVSGNNISLHLALQLIA